MKLEPIFCLVALVICVAGMSNTALLMLEKGNWITGAGIVLFIVWFVDYWVWPLWKSLK
jgi:hypothetical protein